MTENYRRLALELGRQDGSALRLKVTSGSMAPLLLTGDYVHTLPVDPAALRQGDIVVVRHEGELFTHRLVKASPQGWWFKGDWAACLDPLLTLQAAENIVGRVAARERAGSILSLQTTRWRKTGKWLAWLGWQESRWVRIRPLNWLFRLLTALLVDASYLFHRRR